jgi:hypothetical protein
MFDAVTARFRWRSDVLVFLLMGHDAEVELISPASQPLGLGLALGDCQGEDFSSLCEG